MPRVPCPDWSFVRSESIAWITLTTLAWLSRIAPMSARKSADAVRRSVLAALPLSRMLRNWPLEVALSMRATVRSRFRDTFENAPAVTYAFEPTRERRAAWAVEIHTQ